MIAEGGNITLMDVGCGNVLILSSGNPLNNGTTLSTDMNHPGCGANPDGFDTNDCANLSGFTPEGNSLVLALSSEWPEFFNTTFTDWMQMFAFNTSINMSINSWSDDRTHNLTQYGPSESGTRHLADITNASPANLLVADSGDSIFDTALIVAPSSCFGVNVTEPENPFCGNGNVEGNEQCDLGELNGEDNSSCDENCNVVSPPEIGNESDCGNGILEQPPAFPNSTEQCDLGAQNGNQCSTCSDDCKIVTPVIPNVTTTVNVTYISKTTPITIKCTDALPHPVDHSSLFYRYRISDDCKNWGSWTNWTDPAGPDDM